MATIRCIIPAYNEETTVGEVVRAARAAGTCDRIVVVDDGSTDNTARAARDAGAHEVHSLSPNRGKGGAMAFGVARALADSCDAVLFLDSDLVGLTPEHVHLLTAGLGPGVAQVVGMRDFGRYGNMIQMAFPPTSGQRCVRAEVLRRVPASCWSGYRIEMGLNEASSIGETARVYLYGLRQIDKTAKVGEQEGVVQYARMVHQVLTAWRDARQELLRGKQ